MELAARTDSTVLSGASGVVLGRGTGHRHLPKNVYPWNGTSLGHGAEFVDLSAMGSESRSIRMCQCLHHERQISTKNISCSRTPRPSRLALTAPAIEITWHVAPSLSSFRTST